MRWPTFRSPKQDLRDEVTFLRAQVAQLQNYILMVAPTAPVVQGFPATPTPWDAEPAGKAFESAAADEARRMYSTEDEEDIEFAREEGLISSAEAERLLREAGAFSDDIT